MTLGLYSNSAGTAKATNCKLGDTYYVNGSITIKKERSYISVEIDVFKNVGTFVQRLGAVAKIYDFSANLPTTIKTIFDNSCPSLALSKETYSPQRYYLRVKISGNGVETSYAYEDFVVEHCNIQNTNYYTTNNADDQKITKYNAGDVVYVEGSFYTDVAVDDVRVLIIITNPNSVATAVLDTTFNAAAADDNDLRDDVAGGTAITYQLGTVGGAYQVAVQVSKNDWVTADTSYAYFYVPEQTTFGEEAWYKDSIVYEQWLGTQDDYGNKLYDTPVTVPARIKQSEQMVKAASGELVKSVAQVILGASEVYVTANDRITLPDSTQPPILTVKRTAHTDGSDRMQEVFT